MELQQRLYDHLAETARRGDPCPSTGGMASRFKTGHQLIDKALGALAAEGKIQVVYNGYRNSRRIRVGRHWTAPTETGHRRPPERLADYGDEALALAMAGRRFTDDPRAGRAGAPVGLIPLPAYSVTGNAGALCAR